MNYKTLAEIKALNTETGHFFFEKGKKVFHRIISQVAFHNHVIEVSHKYPDKTSGKTVKVWRLNLNVQADLGNLRMVHECTHVDDAKDWVKSQE